jgi:hypothetical protein
MTDPLGPLVIVDGPDGPTRLLAAAVGFHMKGL